MKNKLYVMRSDYVGLEQLVDYINQFSNTKEMDMIEIGSYAGESTEFFSKNFKSVLSIDPYLNDYDPNDAACHHLELNQVYNFFLERIKNINNIKHIKKLSDDAINDINNQKFDFIYIDGLHTYDQVKKDILNYRNIIKDTGFIGGHDYHPGWYGVMRAVDEILGKPDKTFVEYSWIKKKII
jgi:hypothetical protein